MCLVGTENLIRRRFRFSQAKSLFDLGELPRDSDHVPVPTVNQIRTVQSIKDGAHLYTAGVLNDPSNRRILA